MCFSFVFCIDNICTSLGIANIIWLNKFGTAFFLLYAVVACSSVYGKCRGRGVERHSEPELIEGAGLEHRGVHYAPGCLERVHQQPQMDNEHI